MKGATKSVAQEAAKRLFGREAYVSARRVLGNYWRVEVHVDSRGPGRSVVETYDAPSLFRAYGAAAADLRGRAAS